MRSISPSKRVPFAPRGSFRALGARVGRTVACAVLLSAAALTAGCGGPSRSFENNVYREGHQVAFRIPDPPPTWEKVPVSHAALSFHDKAAGASILVNAQCKKADEDTPLAPLTNHLLIGVTERDLESQETVPFDAREALHTKVRGKLDGVPLAFDIFVLKKDGCIYDFVYVVPVDYADAGRPPFEAWVRGFSTLPGSGAL